MAKAEDDVQPSLDQLSQAFAEAMGRNLPANSPADSPAKPRDPGDASPPPDPDPEVEEVADADAACPISPKTILEAILFVGHPDNEPIDGRMVAKLIRGVDASEIDALVDELNQEYEGSEMPVSIQSLAGGHRLELLDSFDHVRQRFYGRVRRAKLSQLAVDVLAIVAYNQPVTRQKVEQLLHHSGSSLARVLNQLVRRELIAMRITEGKPKRREYVTTDRFLDLFELADLGDLPRSEDPQ